MEGNAKVEREWQQNSPDVLMRAFKHRRSEADISDAETKITIHQPAITTCNYNKGEIHSITNA